MLLRFGVQNHLSIRDKQDLSLVASSLKDVDSALIPCDSAPEGRVLPVAVIYGANASGKSNIVSALRFMREVVLYSHSHGDPEGGVPRTPFALDPVCAKAPSIFDADFLAEGTHYHYGFEVSDKIFKSEWLHAFPRGRRQVLFERREDHLSFGRHLKGRNKVISDLTRPNSLFLSAAAQNDHEELSKVSAFFRSLRTDSDFSMPGDMAAHRLAEGEIDKRIIRFLQKIGTGVVDYRRRETELPEDHKAMRRDIAAVLKKFVGEELRLPAEDKLQVSFELAHQGSGGEEVYFDLERESAGTRRLLVLLGRVFRALDEGAPLVIDELDASLHTQACEAVLALFSRANPKGAQLIATTHDTNLLSSELLRRDQVWFAQKDAEGATHLYPLTDIRTRKEDNLEKGYLQGRYGAIPFAGPVADVVNAD